MKSFSLSFIGDVLAIVLSAFSISLVLFTYFLDYPYNLIYSLISTAILTAIFIKIMLSRKSKKAQKLATNKHYLQVIEQLNYQDKLKTDELFLSLIKKRFNNATLRKGGVFIPEKNLLIAPNFSFDEITKTDVIKIFNLLSKDEQVIILTEKFSSPVLEFSKRFNGKITLVDGVKTYETLSSAQTFPEIDFTLQESKNKKVFSSKNLFVKKRAKTFLGFGFAFLFFSFFVPLKTYYVVCGTIMLLYSIVCILFGKENAPNELY